MTRYQNFSQCHNHNPFGGITPFWFWNDQAFTKKTSVNVPDDIYKSPDYDYTYRGWFINDEVLLDYWGTDRYDGNTNIIENNAFEMAMEALLRLGGNMVIPGTDQNSHKYKALAAHMGLYISHHHAEPLGAKMFARTYPDLIPSYRLYPDLFEQLWRDSIEEQKDYNIVWNIGFRGQGDRPFWADDPSYDTPAKRGALISSLMQRQYDLLCEYFDEPVCCTNLYGEVMELFQQGHIQLPDNIIYIWADNGYGKMVSRRQNTHNSRIKALPSSRDGRHGCYYHASFYDLQAASHMTMLSNSLDFITDEFKIMKEHGINDYLIINCSNVKPHTYTLNHMANLWRKTTRDYCECYFPTFTKEVTGLYERYPKVMIPYGPNEDDHAGDQFYHYTLRSICHGWALGQLDIPSKSLIWLSNASSLKVQVAKIVEMILPHLNDMTLYYEEAKEQYRKMQMQASESEDSLSEAIHFKDSLLLQIAIHHYSLTALFLTCQAFNQFIDGDIEKAFFNIGEAIEVIHKIDESFHQAEHDHWSAFYENDCLTDMKFSKRSLKRVMGYLRDLGDGPHYYEWMLRYMNPTTDNVVLITNMRNHASDWELYQAMKQDKYNLLPHKLTPVLEPTVKVMV